MKKFLIDNGFSIYGKCNCSGGYTEKWRNKARSIHIQVGRDKGRIIETGDVTDLETLKANILKKIKEDESFQQVERWAKAAQKN